MVLWWNQSFDDMIIAINFSVCVSTFAPVIQRQRICSSTKLPPHICAITFKILFTRSCWLTFCYRHGLWISAKKSGEWSLSGFDWIYNADMTRAFDDGFQWCNRRHFQPVHCSAQAGPEPDMAHRNHQEHGHCSYTANRITFYRGVLRSRQGQVYSSAL